MVTSWSGLGAISGSVTLLQSASVLMFMAFIAKGTMWIHWVWTATWCHVVSKGHAASRAMLVWVACATTWGHSDIQNQATATKVAAKDHVWVLSQSRSVLKSVAHVATKGHVEIQGQISHLSLTISSNFSRALHTSCVQI